MKPMLHTYGKFSRIAKSIIVGLGFSFPLILIAGIYMDSPESFNKLIADSESAYDLLFSIAVLWPFFLSVTLISAYFYSDITTDVDGLSVEFLWMKPQVKWNQLIKLRPILGITIPFFGKSKMVVLLVNGLTPFHRIFGLIYGFSVLPAIVISPAISDYDSLMQRIRTHLNKDLS